MLIKPVHLLPVHNNPPENLLPWLNYQNSLMDKLKSESGDAKLKVLEEFWTLPSWWDKYTLELVSGVVFHRSILMLSQQIPCWFARTIIPERTYQANQHFFDRLAQEPLGAIIFNEPCIRRMHFLNYQINRQCIEYHWLPSLLSNQHKKIWTRLSIFTIADDFMFCLVEMLLPGLLRVTK